MMLYARELLNYIFLRCAMGCAGVGAVLFALVFLISFTERMREVVNYPKGSVLGAVQLSFLQAPEMLQEIVPFAILVGCILAIASLNRSSELHVIRASGLSAWQFLLPPALVALLAGLIVPILISPVAEAGLSEYHVAIARMREQTQYQHHHDRNGAWLRQTGAGGDAIIRAGTISPQAGLLKDVDIFLFEAEGGRMSANAFSRRLHAEVAQLTEGFWELRAVTENTRNGQTVQHDRLSLPTSLPPGILLHRNVQNNFISFWAFPRRLAETRKAQLDDTAYSYAWHALLATPVLYVALALSGFLVCLRLQRSGGIAPMAGLGIIGGILTFIGIRFARNMALAGSVPPEIAAWCPPVFVLSAVLLMITLNEYG